MARQQIRFGPPLTPIVKKLIILNSAVYFFFLLGQFILPGSIEWLRYQFALMPMAVVSQFKVWQILTYAFLHGGVIHLLWNMLILWMFGSELESFWGRRPFLFFYILCAVGGGIAVCVHDIFFSNGPYQMTLGASGAILGIVVAYGFAFAERQIQLLIPPVSFKAKWLAIGWVALDFILFLEGNRGISYFAHFGGALTAAIYMKSGFRFSPSTRFRIGGLSITDRYRRWKTKRYLRLVKDEQEEQENQGPTYH